MRRLVFALIASLGTLPLFNGCSATIASDGYSDGYPVGGYYYAGNDFAYNGYYDRYPHYYHGRNFYHPDNRFEHRDDARHGPAVEHRGEVVHRDGDGRGRGVATER